MFRKFVAITGLLAATTALATNFVRDGTSLPPTKTDLLTLPPGVDSTKFIRASDFNAVTQSLYDIRGALTEQVIVNVRAKGAVGDCLTDDTDALQAAIDAATEVKGSVYFPGGCYKITTALSVADGAGIVLYGAGAQSKIKKFFNGDMLSLGSLSTVRDLYFDGNGATYTGRGIIITTGGNDQISWRRITGVEIRETRSYCIEFTASRSGFASSVSDSQLSVYNSATYTVKFPVDVTNGNRQLINVTAISGGLADLDGSENTLILGCQSGGAVTNDGLRFTADTIKARVIGNRFAQGTTMMLKGNECAIVGNIFANSVQVTSDLINSVVKDNQITSGASLTDPTGTINHIDAQEFVVYNPTWSTAGGTPPAIGNGLLAGNYTRQGRLITAWVELTAGSTTDFGTGIFQLSLPFAPNVGRTIQGSGEIVRGTNIFPLHVIQASAGSTTMQLLYAGQIPFASVNSSFPLVFTTGDTLRFQVTYSL